MLKDKLKALLVLKNISQVELAKHNEISKQQQSNKINNCSYKLNELVELADFTGTRLAFIDENSKPVVVFDKEDLE